MKNIFFGLCMALLVAACPLAAMATFAVDGGANDDDGVVNGVVTIASPKVVPLTTAVYDQTASDFHILAGGRLILESDASFTTCWIHFANLTIDAGGTIEADGQGYPSGEGPGAGPVSPMQDASSGAGHGGMGGRGSGVPGQGLIYDASVAPEMYGSGGGTTLSAPGGAGGGIVLLRIDGQFTMNGLISANGESGWMVGTNAAGGGSGGAIQIQTDIFAGDTGVFSARGGDGGVGAATQGGGGGGGMIAIHCYQNLSTFIDDPSAVLIDGGSAMFPGEDGREGVFALVDWDYVATQETTWGKVKSLYK